MLFWCSWWKDRWATVVPKPGEAQGRAGCVFGGSGPALQALPLPGFPALPMCTTSSWGHRVSPPPHPDHKPWVPAAQISTRGSTFSGSTCRSSHRDDRPISLCSSTRARIVTPVGSTVASLRRGFPRAPGLCLQTNLAQALSPAYVPPPDS